VGRSPQFRPASRRLAFHGFVLDLDAGFLLRDGEEVPLQPKAFEVLRHLAERPGRIVSRTN
jgi:DNA-binding winged helix-turn-helix (wHTH) protein